MQAREDKRKLEENAKKIDACLKAFKGERLRWLMGIAPELPGKIGEEKFYSAVKAIIKNEIERQQILCEIEAKGPLTVKELSVATNIPSKAVVRYIIALRKAGLIAEAFAREGYYAYSLTQEGSIQ